MNCRWLTIKFLFYSLHWRSTSIITSTTRITPAQANDHRIHPFPRFFARLAKSYDIDVNRGQVSVEHRGSSAKTILNSVRFVSSNSSTVWLFRYRSDGRAAAQTDHGRQCGQCSSGHGDVPGTGRRTAGHRIWSGGVCQVVPAGNVSRFLFCA